MIGEDHSGLIYLRNVLGCEQPIGEAVANRISFPGLFPEPWCPSPDPLLRAHIHHLLHSTRPGYLTLE